MGRSIGRYTLHTRLAAGGMGAVFLGVVRGEGGFVRTVAIKCMHSGAARDPGFVSAFLDEARLASRIRHPNVVSTIDVAHEGGELLVVMDYVHGESLARLLGGSERRGAPSAIAIAVAIGALHGLHAAHEAVDEDGTPLGLVHRDVSPHNIMLGDDGVARVVDFGVAKAAGRLQLTAVGLVKGKLTYMAPEQLEGLPLDRRADIFALGIVLWEALAGRRLFTGASEPDIIANLLTATIAPPSSFEPSLPAAVDAIVMRALDRDPEKRWPNAREMARALERTQLGAPVSDVAEFVIATAGEGLKRRAAQVKEMESSERRGGGEAEDLIARVAAAPPPPSSAPAPIPPPGIENEPTATMESTTRAAVAIPRSEPALPASRMHPLAMTAAAGLVLVGMLVLVFASRRSAPAAQPMPPAAADTGLPAPIEPAPPPSTEAVEAPSAVLAPVAPRPPVVKPRPKPAKPDCTDPYTRDELGRRIYRRECLR